MEMVSNAHSTELHAFQESYVTSTAVDMQAVASAAGLNPSKSYGNLQGQDGVKSESNSSQDVLAKHGIERVRPHPYQQ